MIKWFPRSAIKTPREDRLQLARDCGLIQGRVVMYYLSHFTVDTDNDIEEVRALVLEKDVEGLLQNQSIDRECAEDCVIGNRAISQYLA
ncbi:MAG: hypothetical protein ABI876_12880, partial [Bacteroidota bacterium]